VKAKTRIITKNKAFFFIISFIILLKIIFPLSFMEKSSNFLFPF
jgi:hypothetical protein